LVSGYFLMKGLAPSMGRVSWGRSMRSFLAEKLDLWF
jgi:hypothetical protein